jgi:hypothetical protein
MPLAQQAQFLAHRGGGISDLVYRALQFILRHAEMPGPVLDFMPLAHGDMAAVAPAFVEEIVAHSMILPDEKDPALGMRRGLICLATICGWLNVFFAVSSVVHEQRKNDDDRQRDANQPEQCTSTETHVSLLEF